MATDEETETRDAVGEEPDPRFTFANERTFLAWNRTALALVAGSLAAGHLIDFESEVARLVTALSPLLLAIWLPVVSYRRWDRNERALRLGEPLPPSSLPLALAIGTGLLVVLVAVLVVLGEAR
jgi:putative membrane protein